MSVLFAAGSELAELSAGDAREGLFQALEKLGKRRKVIAVPPDFTRFHSKSGEFTRYAWEYYGENLAHVLPALGTHRAMTPDEISQMFGEVPQDLFRVHDWRNDTVTLGEVPGAFVHEQSAGELDYPWPAQVNRLLVEGNCDLILSIGQVVPHEVIGVAGYNKNILIGTGGRLGIHRSHFLGAVCGVERIMGHADNPVRRVLNYAGDHFARHLPIVYVLTVIGKNSGGELVLRGLFVGDDVECFHRAAELSLRVNVQLFDHEIQKAVVFLDPQEFKSTWLGNKAIYRTRMALADRGELIILAPGVREFGEDQEIDKMIRKYGYHGTPATMAAVKQDRELADNLGAAAHLIQGSSEGRFQITYCPGHLSREEVEQAGFRYAPLDVMLARYSPSTLRDGYNRVNEEDIFYVSHPGLGLWASEKRYKNSQEQTQVSQVQVR
jgi:nickel-dependent lactate racemase